MRISRFQSRKIHGFMNFDLTFNKKLTFLTGINGSGKTSVVRGISALITPALLSLAYTDYESMEVTIDVRDVKGDFGSSEVKIWANKYEDYFSLRCSELEHALEIELYPRNVRAPRSKAIEKEREYYAEKEAEFLNHPVLKFVRRLPSPLLLGIERRGNDTRMFAPRRNRFFVQRRHSGAPISSSLYEAIDIAEESYRIFSARQRRLQDKLRRNILRSAFRFEVTNTNFADIRSQASRIKSTKSEVFNTLKQLGLPKEDYKEDLTAFFDELEMGSQLLRDEKDNGGGKRREQTNHIAVDGQCVTVASYYKDT